MLQIHTVCKIDNQKAAFAGLYLLYKTVGNFLDFTLFSVLDPEI